MKDYHINIFYSDDDDGYIADIPDLEACSAFGKTPDEALREVEIANPTLSSGYRLLRRIAHGRSKSPLFFGLSPFKVDL